MHPPNGPSVAIEVTRGARPMLVLRRSIGQEDFEERFELAPGGILRARRDVQAAVNVLRRSLRLTLEQPADWEGVERGLRELYTVGTATLHQLFGEDGLPRFINTLHDLLPELNSAAGGLPEIQLIADTDTVLPIELLPALMTAEERRPIRDYPTLQESASRFLGFSANVRRHIRGGRVTHPPLAQIKGSWVNVFPNAAGLSVSVFQNATLGSVSIEVGSLQSYGVPHVVVLGPWPGPEETTSDPDGIIAKILCENPARPGEFWPHVLHFACHCRASDDPTEIALLLQGDQPTSGVDVRLVELEARSGVLRIRRPTGEASAPRLPLVFLNACSSGASEPLTGASLPAFFLRRGYVGFIGTETAVPDEVAAEISSKFYDNFLGGRSLGQSMWLSKWSLLRRYRNPLGLLYTTYADGDIYVEHALERNLDHDG
ncbi:CHAT domain-containing protein [Streptomyces lunaelactis]|uniref:CHAT domain-containing protein n=1 Tax=Streptomyces lunaelactis TaxID=1535768 RepID=UPI00158560DC|nr:CHAT domain-containing protein [Streptomyces lunaelactis]NUK09959.1 CHAT domain-containing protein [Streptomyces lunaelactis]NUK72731.1 CHAT domain-containing protein [Streptomyces lunaelactis]NUL11423.1 CHAT domain-containing protein [Streptomyces lunaelactis]NUL25348.1 CHAT domain-containing protein [Streptomyces lunaelactis]